MLEVPTPDLPVAWWVFWLVVMTVGVFAALVWWLIRAAVREDRAPRSDDEHGRHEEPRLEQGPNGTKR